MSTASESSEEHFDEYEHYNYDQEKAMNSGHSGEFFDCYDLAASYFDILGKQRTKKEAEQNTNRHNPGGHERKITTKLMNMEKNLKAAGADGSKSKWDADLDPYTLVVASSIIGNLIICQ